MTDKLTPAQLALVERNVKMARSVAMSVWIKNREGMDGAEVVAVAFQGLVQAAQRFDPEYHDGADKFETNQNGFLGYAKKRILGAILDWQRQEDHVPRQQRKKYRDLQSHGHGTGRTTRELVELSGYDANTIRSVTRAVEDTAVSLDTPPEYWDGDTQYAVIANSGVNVESAAAESAIVSSWIKVWRELPDLDKKVIVGKYYLMYDFFKISEDTGVRLPLVREAHSRAVLKLFDAMMREAA